MKGFFLFRSSHLGGYFIKKHVALGKVTSFLVGSKRIALGKITSFLVGCTVKKCCIAEQVGAMSSKLKLMRFSTARITSLALPKEGGFKRHDLTNRDVFQVST